MSGDGIRPLDYPPPFRAADFIAKPGPPNDLRISGWKVSRWTQPAGVHSARAL